MHDSQKDKQANSDTPALLEQHIGRRFSDREILERALTHRSYVHEHIGAAARHNESMEFLGDSILGFVISEELYQRFPLAEEGLLSKTKAYLVSASNLHRLARDMELGRFLRMSSGEEKTGGRRKRAILVDAYEALIAAIYIDGGIDAARHFILEQFHQALDRIDVEKIRYEDFKSTLQERLHLMHLPEPIYEVVEEQGPDHSKTFVVQLSIRCGVAARAAGRTKKEAQQQAAALVLQLLDEKHECEPPPR